MLSAYLAKKNSRKEINKRAIVLMRKTGIAELADHDITQASCGQLPRVVIYRALINNSDSIFGEK